MNNCWQRASRYEYWPFWVFYAPFVPIWLYYSFKSKSFTYFTNSNPGIENGGFVRYSKYDVLYQIPEKYLPKGILIRKNELSKLKKEDLPDDFPLIVKPNMGERGKDVYLAKDIKEIRTIFSEKPQDYIIQEYIDYPIELSVFYYHYPNKGKYGITGITLKHFLTFTGDGKTTIKEFIYNDVRAYGRKKYLLKKHQSQLNMILPEGEQMIVEPIGNHSRGTTFLDKSEWITRELENFIHSISKHVKDFYYGRVDLKAASLKDLHERKNIKIFEINGVNSEAIHMYDPYKYNLYSAYSEVLRHLRIQYEISRENHDNGFKYQSDKDLLFALLNLS